MTVTSASDAAAGTDARRHVTEPTDRVALWRPLIALAAALLPGTAGSAAAANLSSLALTTAAGKHFDGTALRGKIVLVAFARLNQRYSEHVLSDLREIQHDRGNDEVACTAVFSGDIKAEEVEALGARLGLKFPLLLDPDWKAYASFGIVVRPTVWIIAPDGDQQIQIPGYHRDLETRVAADIAFLEGKISETERVQRTAPAHAPSFVGTAGSSVRYKLALRLLDTGRRDAAKKQLEIAWTEDPPVAMAGVDLALLLLQEGKNKEALAILDKALPLAADSPRALGAKGVGLVRAGKLKDGRALLQRAVEAGATEPLFYYELAQASRKLGTDDEACRYNRLGFETLLRKQGLLP